LSWSTPKVILTFTSKAVGMNSLGAKAAGTVVILFGWLAIIVLYLAFFAGDFHFWQKLAVFIASGAIVTAIVAVMWIKWAVK
jgi:phosphate starvation-inducible membrane PsiE